MLSKTELWDIFTGAKKPGMREGEADDAGLRAVAEAAVKDAVGGDEPEAYVMSEEIYWHDEPDINDHIRNYGTPLYTRPQASAAVPEGFVLVPRTLTGQMVDASGCGCQPGKSAYEVAQRQWDDMLAASEEK